MITASINTPAKISAKALVIGDVSKKSLGLDAVDNTSDLDKPISTAQQTAIDLKADQETTYTKVEVDGAISSLIADAPGALDTLNELAAALGDDENFATTTATSIGAANTNIATNASAITDNYAATPHNTDSVIICNQGDNIQDKLDEAALLLSGIGGTLIVMAGQYGNLSLTDDNIQTNIIGIGNPTIGYFDDNATFVSTGATYKNFTCSRFVMNRLDGNIENITTDSFYLYQNNSTGTIKNIKTGTYFECDWNNGTIKDITCGTYFRSDFDGNYGTIKDVNAETVFVENNLGTVDNVNATGDLITNNDGIIKNCSAGGKFELALNNGIIDNCHSNGTDRGFGGYLGSYNSGTIKNCTAKGEFSFGQQTADGVTENCIGVNKAFVGSRTQVSGNIIEGTYRNCRGGNNSFFGANTSSSDIKTAQTNYINCTAGGNSFCFVNTAGAETHFSGTAINCTSGNNGFCGSVSGITKILADAVIENCTAGGNNSFASNSTSFMEGTILRCRTGKTGANPFRVSVTGKVRLCLDGNYNEVNLG